MELTEQQRNKKSPAHAAYMQRFTLRWACEHPAEPAVVPEFMNRVQAFDGDLLARDPGFVPGYMPYYWYRKTNQSSVSRRVTTRATI